MGRATLYVVKPRCKLEARTHMIRLLIDRGESRFWPGVVRHHSVILFLA